MNHPKVMTEFETIEAAKAGASLARYGDGELKLAMGRDCVSQKAGPALAAELRAILKAPPPGVLACIPSPVNAKGESWAKFATRAYLDLYGDHTFGSAFVTRPDSAPWIDTEAYWAAVVDLWRDKDVTLVVGTDRSLRAEMMPQAKSVRVVRDEVSHRDAYSRIDAIEAEIGTPAGPVILCLGATATVLAARLAKKGVHALDLGHIGMFMRHAGAYRHQPEDLASSAYRAQLVRMRQGRRWGGDGAKHAAPVLAWAEKLQAESILDYGCGEQALAEALKPRRVMGYDAGIIERAGLPKPADLVVCTDVLEHVEPDKLDAVLDHIRRLASKGAYLVIATRPAKAILPDGRNAHLIVEPAEWWIDKLSGLNWTLERADHKPGHDLTCWVRA